MKFTKGVKILERIKYFIEKIKSYFYLTKRKYIFVLFFIYLAFICSFLLLYFKSYKQDILFEKKLLASYQEPLLESASKHTFIFLKRFTDLKNNVKNVFILDLENKVITTRHTKIPFSEIKPEDINYLQNIIKSNKYIKFFYEIVPYYSYGKLNETIAFFKKIGENKYKIYIFDPEKLNTLFGILPSTLNIKVKVGEHTLLDINHGPMFSYREYRYFIGNLPVNIRIELVKTKELLKYEGFEENLLKLKVLIILIFILILTLLNNYLFYKETKFVSNTIKNLKEKLENARKVLDIHFKTPYLEAFIPKFLEIIKKIFKIDKAYLKIIPDKSYFIDEKDNIKKLSIKEIKELDNKLNALKVHFFKNKEKYYYYFPIKTKRKILGYLLLETKKILNELDRKLLEIITYTLGSTLDSELKLEDIFYLIANIIEARDPYTKGHSLRVAHYARWIAKKLGLPQETCEKIFKAGILHDIGKIGIPDIVLLKPGKLTDQEYETMKMHAEFTYYILNTVPSLREFANIARYHHERWDGRGYPKGLKGEKIPLESRILAIADAIDAMTSTRPYRKALSFEKAKEELLYNAGKQFDPKIISVILPYIDELKSIKTQVDMRIEKFLPEEIEKLRSYIFFHDPTTGCYQINAFLKELDNLIVKEEEFCLALIDVKNLLDFIEIKGFDAADQVLSKIAQIIQEYTPLVARDSDMFFFVIKDKNCEKVLKEIKDRIKENLKVDLHSVLIKYSGEKKTGHNLLVELLKKLKNIKKNKDL